MTFRITHIIYIHINSLIYAQIYMSILRLMTIIIIQAISIRLYIYISFKILNMF
jgi:hypothetical protein